MVFGNTFLLVVWFFFFFFGVVLFKMFILSFESHKIYSFVTLFLHCLFYQTGLVSSSLMKGKGGESRSVMSSSLQPHELYSPRNSPGQNTGMRSCSLHQGIFPTQGSNSVLPHCRGTLYQLSPREALHTMKKHVIQILLFRT